MTIKYLNLKKLSGSNWYANEPCIVFDVLVDRELNTINPVDVLNAKSTLELIHDDFNRVKWHPSESDGKILLLKSIASLAVFILNRNVKVIETEIITNFNGKSNIVLGYWDDEITTEALNLASSIYIYLLEFDRDDEKESSIRIRLEEFWSRTGQYFFNFELSLLISGGQISGTLPMICLKGEQSWLFTPEVTYKKNNSLNLPNKPSYPDKKKFYRLFLMNHEVLSILKVEPRKIVGDGVSSILEIVKKINKNTNTLIVNKVILDDKLIDWLRRFNFDLATVLENKKIFPINQFKYTPISYINAGPSILLLDKIKVSSIKLSKTLNGERLGVDYLVDEFTDLNFDESRLFIDNKPNLERYLINSECKLRFSRMFNDKLIIQKNVRVFILSKSSYLEGNIEKFSRLNNDTAVIFDAQLFIGEKIITTNSYLDAMSKIFYNNLVKNIDIYLSESFFLNNSLPVLVFNSIFLDFELNKKTFVLAVRMLENVSFEFNYSIIKNDNFNNFSIKSMQNKAKVVQENIICLDDISSEIAKQIEGIDCSGYVSLFSVVFDERPILPHFLKHYRSLGVEKFIFFDDGSTDGSINYLSQQPDVYILQDKKIKYDGMYNNIKAHHLLRELIPEACSKSQWWLVVDADEFLVLPPSYSNIRDIFSVLDAQNQHYIFASMVDFYPEKLPIPSITDNDNIFSVYPYYDINTSVRRLFYPYKVEKSLNGIRGRYISKLCNEYPELFVEIYSDKGYISPALSKIPMLKTGNGLKRKNSHNIQNHKGIVPTTENLELIIAHFKFNSSLVSKLQIPENNNKYYLNGIEQNFIKLLLSKYDNTYLTFEGSACYSNSEKLYSDLFDINMFID